MAPPRWKDTPLTVALLKAHLAYDATTGIFTRRLTTYRHQAGDIACMVHAKNHGYVVIGVLGKKHLAHRLAWLYVHGEWPARDLDHKNRIRHDNRIDNLRLATESENLRNVPARRTNKSGFKGVTHKLGLRNPWVANIYLEGRQTHLGCFPTREAASAAFQAAQKEHFGEFARSE